MKNLFPFLPLKTERLIMKQTSPEDIELILKMDKQKDTQAYLGGIKEYTRQEKETNPILKEAYEARIMKAKNYIKELEEIYIKQKTIQYELHPLE